MPGKRVSLIFTILLVLLFSLSFSLAKVQDSQKIRVVVELDNENKLGIKTNNEIVRDSLIREIGEEKVKYRFKTSSFSAELTGEDIERLIAKGAKVRKEKIFYALLQDSAPLVNATITWPLQVSGTNLTGINQTICIIDTGANYTHHALGGCYGNNTANSSCKVIGGYDFVNSDTDPMDDHGHGTHVAGIVAANGSINGIATSSKIVAIKALNSAGTGIESNVVAGIDWCAGNSSLFNISIISLSLGDLNNYTTYCDANYSEMSASINSAFAKNISIVIATGNNGNYTGISGPACIQNATAVGATTKADAIASYSQRNSLVRLMAPGSSINSTKIDGTYSIESGTSMAAPHVAGAIAIINQFLRLTGQTRTPKQIEAILNNTGKRIADSQSGLNFSRINIYAAILSLDNMAPNVTLILPANNHLNMSGNQTFSCNATDYQLANVTIYLWNSTGNIVNQTTINASGTFNLANFNISNLNFGAYKWNCYYRDANNNLGFFYTGNFTLAIGGISATLLSPEDNNYTNVNATNFSCQSTSETASSLTNATFYLWNSTSLAYNETRNISGTSNVTSLNYTFNYDGSYKWTCKSWNNASNFSIASNFTINYDSIKPVINLISPTDSTSSTTTEYNFTFSVSDASNVTCNLIFDNARINSISLSNVSSNGMYNSSLAVGNHTWSVNCTDLAGNQGNSSVRNLTINSPTQSQQSSSSSDGGGGGAVVILLTYAPTADELAQGYTKELKKGDKIKFIIENSSHQLILSNIKNNTANITISSNTISIVLNIGQEIKINLSSSEHYDLFVKLNSITGNKASITVQKIKEKIIKEETFGVAAGEENESQKTNGTSSAITGKQIITLEAFKQVITSKIFIVILIFMVIAILISYIIVKNIRHKRLEKELKRKK